jgi:hypothetical protein
MAQQVAYLAKCQQVRANFAFGLAPSPQPETIPKPLDALLFGDNFASPISIFSIARRSSGASRAEKAVARRWRPPHGPLPELHID